jgi:hypothetical protein
MRSQRAARALLRLYPRAWRERYGDEFIGLIDDTGLSGRVIADVVHAASVQRLRAIAAFRTPDPDAIGTGRTLATIDAYDLLLPTLIFTALVSITVAVLSPVGLAFAGWMWLLMTAGNFMTCDGPLIWPRSTIAARVARGYYFLIEGLVFGIALWFASRGLATAGVPAPPDGFEFVFIAIFLAGFGRLIQVFSRRSRRPDEWVVVRRSELAAWRAVAVIFYSVVIIADPDSRMIWQFATFWYLIGRTPFSETPLGAARRRAAYELNQQRLREKFPVQSFPKDWR